MDILTDQVAQQYQHYPFPNSKGDINYYQEASWFKEMIKFFEVHAPEGQKSFLERSSILEVGCGTGPTISWIANKFPECTALGIDIASNSLFQAEQTKEFYKIKNLKFLEENLLTMKLQKKFDVIIAVGVLHHLSDIEQGLKNLLIHLNQGGYLVLWVYGEYGRYYLHLNQKILKILFSSVADLDRKVELTKRFLTHAPQSFLSCHIDTPSQEQDGFEKKIQYILENESWLVDQFLHVNECAFNINTIFYLLEKHDLNLVNWLNVSENFLHYIKDKQIMELFKLLPKKKQLEVIDLLIKPNFYCMIVSR